MKIALSMCSWLVALPLLAFAHTAQADQCQWVEGPAAETAVKILKDHPDLRLFCALCQDKKVTAIKVVKAEVQQASMGGKPQPYKVVRVTDDAGKSTDIDLAYAYVRMDPQASTFTNLAKLASCPARDVPETIGADGQKGAQPPRSGPPAPRPQRPPPPPPPSKS